MQMNYLLSPPIAFLIIFAAAVGFSALLSRLAFRGGVDTPWKYKPYACGEDIASHMIQPDYAQFLPFAFFFTILHVVALIVTTVPVETQRTLVIAIAYLVGAVVGLTVLYRR